MSLQIWLPLTDDTTQQGLSDSQAVATGAAPSTGGKVGGCYAFNGTDNYIGLTKGGISADELEWSMCTWIQFTALPTTDKLAAIYTQRPGTSTSSPAIFVTPTGFYFQDVARWEYQFTSYPFTTGVWYHLAFVRTTTQKIIYLNGKEVGRDNTAASSSRVLGVSATIGGTQNSDAPTASGTHWFNGSLNDFRVYNHALSLKEVREIAKGLRLHLKLDRESIQDVSGFKHGIITEGSLPINSSSPVYSSSIFVSSGAYIGIDGIMNRLRCSPISISCWIKIDEAVTANTLLIGCWESGGGGPIIYNNQKILSEWRINGAYRDIYSTTTITPGEWMHIATTYDNRYLKLYINGVLEGEYDAGANYEIAYNATCPWEIGGNPSATAFVAGGVTGYMSDVRLYSTALSADDVMDLYILHSKIDEHECLYCGEFYEIDDSDNLLSNGVWKTQDYYEFGVDEHNTENKVKLRAASTAANRLYEI